MEAARDGATAKRLAERRVPATAVKSEKSWWCNGTSKKASVTM